jgi:hypothetical protein
MRQNTKFFLKIIILVIITIYFPNASFANTLDIYVKASQENMNSGKFDVEFHEIVVSGTVREFSFPSHGYIEKYMTAFVNSNAGTAVIDDSSQKIKFEFTASGNVVYGYTITPAANTNGSGYCNKDIGIFDLYSSFPYNIMYDNTFVEINLTYDIPGNMELYTPWNDDINNQIQLKTNSMTETLYNVTAWGNFTKVEKHLYGTHTFYMLGYGTDTTNNFKITKITYDYFMKAFAHNYDFLAPANLHIVLPENEGYIHPLGEGFGGAYMSDIVGNNWEPIFKDYPNPCGGDYFRWTQNGNALTVAPVHHIAHATLNGFINDWWPVEGIAVYYQIVMLQKAGILTSDEMEKEFAAHLTCYQNEIIGSEDDHSLKNFQAFTYSDYTTKMIGYIKGALVFYAINEIIVENSNGTLELIDFFTYLFKNTSTSTNYDEFISLLNSFTGKDFSKFFEQYIYSNQPLPLELVGDKIILTYTPPSIPPIVKIHANTQNQLLIKSGSDFSLKADLTIFPDMEGLNSDYWIVADTPFGWYSFSENTGWKGGIYPYKKGPLTTFSSSIFDDIVLPIGNYTFYFAIDNNMDGNPDATWLDIAQVQIQDHNSVSGSEYKVYGGNKFLNGVDNYEPAAHGYLLLGSSISTETFEGKYNYYIIYCEGNNVVYVDAIQGSNGKPFNNYDTGNVDNHENLGGYPDSKFAVMNDTYDSNSFIIVDASSDSLSSITVHVW